MGGGERVKLKKKNMKYTSGQKFSMFFMYKNPPVTVTGPLPQGFFRFKLFSDLLIKIWWEKFHFSPRSFHIVLQPSGNRNRTFTAVSFFYIFNFFSDLLVKCWWEKFNYTHAVSLYKKPSSNSNPVPQVFFKYIFQWFVK